MLTLGINYGSHDSAAAIARDGEILFATAEERLSRKKHDGGFPLIGLIWSHEDCHAGAFRFCERGFKICYLIPGEFQSVWIRKMTIRFVNG